MQQPLFIRKESQEFFESLIKVRNWTKVELFMEYVSPAHSEPSIRKNLHTGTGLAGAALGG